jgi:phage tail protein X
MAGWVVYANVLGVLLAVLVTAVGLADRRKDIARVSAESASGQAS